MVDRHKEFDGSEPRWPGSRRSSICSFCIRYLLTLVLDVKLLLLGPSQVITVQKLSSLLEFVTTWPTCSHCTLEHSVKAFTVHTTGSMLLGIKRYNSNNCYICRLLRTCSCSVKCGSVFQ